MICEWVAHIQSRLESVKYSLLKRKTAVLKKLAKPFGVFPSTIFYHLRKLGITCKKTTLYTERDEEKRRDFMAEIESIDPFEQQDYARAPRVKQVISDVRGKKYGRISVIAAWLSRAKKMTTPYVLNGYTDSHLFSRTWF